MDDYLTMKKQLKTYISFYRQADILPSSKNKMNLKLNDLSSVGKMSFKGSKIGSFFLSTHDEKQLFAIANNWAKADCFPSKYHRRPL